MITADFCADADGTLSMVTHHQVSYGVPKYEDIEGDVYELYNYIKYRYMDEVYLYVGDYSVRVRHKGYGNVEVYLVSQSDFGTVDCKWCSLIITDNEVHLMISTSEDKRLYKRLCVKRHTA